MENSSILLTKCLNVDTIRQIASPSNFKYGQAIFDQGGIELVGINKYVAQGWVGGISYEGTKVGRRKTTIASTPEGLEWSCSCNSKDRPVFCKHCVALALAVHSL